MSGATLARFENVIGEADMLAMERVSQLMRDRDFTLELKALFADNELPVLCLHGSHDPGVSYEAAETLREIVPQTVLKKYEGGGHSEFMGLQTHSPVTPEIARQRLTQRCVYSSHCDGAGQGLGGYLAFHPPALLVLNCLSQA
jgi:hypothetical protein